jgi:hypothetical protein
MEMKMRALLVLLSTTFCVPALAQQATTRDETPIVVTGTPLSETEARLKACLARRCAPNEDIEASLAHAENQFIVGDYAGAQSTLAKSRTRNNRFAAQFPVPVGDLNRAIGRIADMDGRPDYSRISQIAALDALKAGLDSTDSRVLMQRLMVGDEFARAGRLIAADEVYRRVEKQARKSGNLPVVGQAMLHAAAVNGAFASVSSLYRPAAEQKIVRIERTTEPELKPYRDAVKMLRASLAALNHDQSGLEKAISTMAPQSPSEPLLLHAPTVDTSKIAASSGSEGVTEGDEEWIDFHFEIGADGKVAAVEAVRDSGKITGRWADLVKKAIAGRRYAPLALPQGISGVERTERFSLVHDVSWATGSRMAVRKGAGRITSLDLTPTANSGGSTLPAKHGLGDEAQPPRQGSGAPTR